MMASRDEMTRTQYDVAVVGAGPAGATAARELAQSGARVALIERERLPRYKSCAGGVPLRTAALLPFDLSSVVEDNVSGLNVSYFGRHAFSRWSSTPFAHMVMRARFDALLTEQAQRSGAELLSGAPLRSLQRTRAGFALTAGSHELEAAYVVGADGANSTVARASGLGVGLHETVALEAEVCAPPAALERWRGMVNVDFGYRPWGYGWVFPKERLLSIGLVLPRQSGGDLRRALRRYLAGLGLANARTERIVGHKLLLRRTNAPIAGSGVLLAGDAAGLVDEFTEEGIYYAVRSGGLAASAVLRALGEGTPALASYQRAINRELQPELRAARVVAELFYGALRRAPRAMLGLGGRVGYFWEAFFRVQQGASSYDEELARAWWLRPIAPLVLRAARNG
jgi:geranylgeranyl reductase family protein